MFSGPNLLGNIQNKVSKWLEGGEDGPFVVNELRAILLWWCHLRGTQKTSVGLYSTICHNRYPDVTKIQVFQVGSEWSNIIIVIK